MSLSKFCCSDFQWWSQNRLDKRRFLKSRWQIGLSQDIWCLLGFSLFVSPPFFPSFDGWCIIFHNNAWGILGSPMVLSILRHPNDLTWALRGLCCSTGSNCGGRFRSLPSCWRCRGLQSELKAVMVCIVYFNDAPTPIYSYTCIYTTVYQCINIYIYILYKYTYIYM